MKKARFFVVLLLLVTLSLDGCSRSGQSGTAQPDTAGEQDARHSDLAGKQNVGQPDTTGEQDAGQLGGTEDSKGELELPVDTVQPSQTKSATEPGKAQEGETTVRGSENMDSPVSGETKDTVIELPIIPFP